ncbi:Uu.00g023370.m01.CDS01 [Anthostomella pinea]|uniref:Uu.00g023370.m01.CDS01 n=1 Tax=Anthostomella pinea TaxID=933095 RepID=A0AAI8W191_9PEZI|nr:Uu.00g023370.m01.CDS01 [Anthostomella pinea]
MSSYIQMHKTASKGTGVFTVRDTPAGTTLLRKKPIITGTAGPSPDTTVYSAKILRQAEVMQLHEYRRTDCETTFKAIAYQYVAKNPAVKFSSGHYLSVPYKYATNGWGSMLCLTISRFNHSCANNADMVSSSDPKHPARVVAARDIRNGDEITVTYIEVCMADRAAKLAHVWGFACQCPVSRVQHR